MRLEVLDKDFLTLKFENPEEVKIINKYFEDNDDESRYDLDKPEKYLPCLEVENDEYDGWVYKTEGDYNWTKFDGKRIDAGCDGYEVWILVE